MLLVVTVDETTRSELVGDDAHWREMLAVKFSHAKTPRMAASQSACRSSMRTLRADVSNAFNNMTPVERLFAHAGIALFAAH